MIFTPTCLFFHFFFHFFFDLLFFRIRFEGILAAYFAIF